MLFFYLPTLNRQEPLIVETRLSVSYFTLGLECRRRPGAHLWAGVEAGLQEKCDSTFTGSQVQIYLKHRPSRVKHSSMNLLSRFLRDALNVEDYFYF